MTSVSRAGSVSTTTVSLGDSTVVVDIAARFWSASAETHLRLAEQGARAAAAIPFVVDALERGPWRLQTDAAHALGFIGDGTAAPALVRALSSRSWMVVFESARALGRIGVDVGPDAAAHLAALRDEHWSAVVRDAADVALRRVTGERIDEVNDSGVSQVIADHREEGAWAHGPVCDVIGDADAMQSAPHLYARVGNTWIDGSIADDPVNEVDLAMLRRLPPREMGDARAVEVEDGTMVGRDAGEWGGDLHFISHDGVATRLLNANVLGLKKVDDAVLVFTGLAHLGINEGELVRVQRDHAGWHATPLVTLPEAPYGIRAVSPHAFVVTGESNAAIVDIDGNIEPVACRLVEPH